jgi:hypothetical protein
MNPAPYCARGSWLSFGGPVNRERRNAAVRVLCNRAGFGQDKLDPLEDFLTVCPAGQWPVRSDQAEDFIIECVAGARPMGGDAPWRSDFRGFGIIQSAMMLTPASGAGRVGMNRRESPPI